MLTANKTVSIFVSMHYTKFTPNRNRTYIPCLEGRCSIH